MRVLLATSDFASSFAQIYPNLEIYDYRPGRSFPKWSGDLLIFTGGEDLNPGLYGNRPAGTYHWNTERDDKEQVVWDMWTNNVISAKKVLGVCRGHQFLNVMNGGTLHQDLPSIGKGHRQGHPIKWKEHVNEKLASLTEVNSLHHQAIARIGQSRGPIILGEEPNTEVIESIIWNDNIFGVQFHPEWLGDSYRELFWSVIEDWINGTPIVKGQVPSRDERAKRERVKRIEHGFTPTFNPHPPEPFDLNLGRWRTVRITTENTANPVPVDITEEIENLRAVPDDTEETF